MRMYIRDLGLLKSLPLRYGRYLLYILDLFPFSYFVQSSGGDPIPSLRASARWILIFHSGIVHVHRSGIRMLR